MAKKRAKLIPVQDGRPGYYVELDNSEICDGGGSGGGTLDSLTRTIASDEEYYQPDGSEPSGLSFNVLENSEGKKTVIGLNYSKENSETFKSYASFGVGDIELLQHNDEDDEESYLEITPYNLYYYDSITDIDTTGADQIVYNYSSPETSGLYVNSGNAKVCFTDLGLQIKIHQGDGTFTITLPEIGTFQSGKVIIPTYEFSNRGIVLKRWDSMKAKALDDIVIWEMPEQ